MKELSINLVGAFLFFFCSFTSTTFDYVSWMPVTLGFRAVSFPS